MAARKSTSRPKTKKLTRWQRIGRFTKGNKLVVLLALVLFAAVGTAILSRSSAQTVHPGPPATVSLKVTQLYGPNGGPGAWLMTADRYYIGRVMNGWQFKVNQVNKPQADGSRFVYGHVIGGGVSKCGWIDTGVTKSIGLSSYTVTDRSCMGVTHTRLDNRHRDQIGENFNCPDSFCADGTHRYDDPLPTRCNHTLYYNLSSGFKQPANGTAANSKVVTGTVHYRFKIRGSSAAVVRSDQYGWGFMSSTCFGYSLTNAGGLANPAHFPSVDGGYWCGDNRIRAQGPCADPATIRNRSR